MWKRKSWDNEAQLDELGNDPGQVGSDSAGQSGDTQGLSQIADAASESIEELADTDQAYEAEAIGGVEDAANHPERPVGIREYYARSDDIPVERGEWDRDRRSKGTSTTNTPARPGKSGY